MTAVARSSSPANGAALMRAPSGARRALPRGGPERLSQVGELAPERRDVALVPLDGFLVGLQAIEDALVVLLVPVPHRLLLGELGLRVDEALLLARELVLEDLAPVVVARAL